MLQPSLSLVAAKDKVNQLFCLPVCLRCRDLVISRAMLLLLLLSSSSSSVVAVVVVVMVVVMVLLLLFLLLMWLFLLELRTRACSPSTVFTGSKPTRHDERSRYITGTVFNPCIVQLIGAIPNRNNNNNNTTNSRSMRRPTVESLTSCSRCAGNLGEPIMRIGRCCCLVVQHKNTRAIADSHNLTFDLAQITQMMHLSPICEFAFPPVCTPFLVSSVSYICSGMTSDVFSGSSVPFSFQTGQFS
ncbi:unnamed protein product [Polarella glacialis]|uniref:Uncharacterized protein n=1 Tax=Polarella glacialis TaxID=89957 RepID=A0A813KGX7_POLGL|nr:unnamed protein product [Polarella glacialis]